MESRKARRVMDVEGGKPHAQIGGVGGKVTVLRCPSRLTQQVNGQKELEFQGMRWGKRREESVGNRRATEERGKRAQ